MASAKRESPARQEDALEHLASIDLIQLCNEAKIERCRATRDLSCCGRHVQHVLNSCGHASLCAECSQRCDACPICRTSLPRNGNRLQLRLYNKCIEAGLISKRYDDRFQEDNGEGLAADIQHLYSLFDVALENNLVSLICHYITDVCMDESAVSSDPVLAFLLDEVVVKDWCKRTFNTIIFDLERIYSLGVEEMKSKLPIIQKFGVQLTGISSVLEVMDSSLKDTFSAQLPDLHELFENTLKAKQHLEIMTWCIQHKFLENVHSRYPDYDAWNEIVHERKSAAIERSWPESPDNVHTMTNSSVLHGYTLFIEEALLNLAIEESYARRLEGEMDISCLQDGKSPLSFRSKIDDINRYNKEEYYPFKTLRAAIDVLFLHGASDTIVAKQATFLYYLFDRYWTRPDVEWRYLVDDFSACFGISRHSVLESLAFYLLDDHTDQALQIVSQLLPEIADPETHPRIAQVLLERQCPDVALAVLRCSGRDGSCASSSLEHDVQNISLCESLIAVRVRVECGLLTEAFMCQRMHGLIQKRKSKNGFHDVSSDWMHNVEVIVTEICRLCIRRNLVDRMIELPWNSDEEKYLHKCLFDYAHLEPSTMYGSLLVVYYLQRYRYIEAYQVDCRLQSLEKSFIKTANDDVASRIRSISNWRTGLIEKCLDLLPEAQKQEIMTGNMPDINGLPSEFVMSGKPPIPTGLLTSSSLTHSIVFHTNLDSFSSRKNIAEVNVYPSDCMNNGRLNCIDRTPSSIHSKLHASLGNPFGINTLVADASLSKDNFKGNDACSNDTIVRDIRNRAGVRQFKASRVLRSDHVSPTHKDSSQLEPYSILGHAEDFNPLFPKVTSEGLSNGILRKSGRGSRDKTPLSGKTTLLDGPLTVGLKEANLNFSWRKGESPLADSNMKGGPRWRSDESSEEDEGHVFDGYMGSGTVSVFHRPRHSRR